MNTLWRQTDKPSDGTQRMRLAVSGFAALLLAGCAGPHAAKSDELRWPYPDAPRVAVAPALNFSGESSLDIVRVSDLLASELTQVQGVTVVPVSRVVAALARDGGLYVRSPAHAMQVCRTVGADAVLIPAVTEYNPYSPMQVGLALELYMLEADAALTASGPGQGESPVAQIQQVFDASQDRVVKQVREFADLRNRETGAYGWRRYLVTQEGYLRFCLRKSLDLLFQQESLRMSLAQKTETQ